MGPRASDALMSLDGIRCSLRAPSNYDPTFAHPLLVNAPSGLGVADTDALTRLTSPATGRGCHGLCRTPENIGDDGGACGAAQGPSRNAGTSTSSGLRDGASGWRYRFDRDHLYQTRGIAAGIAPSAAGFPKRDFETFECHAAHFPVIVVPRWGADDAEWWAACNGCVTMEPPWNVSHRCVAYQGRATPTRFSGPRHADSLSARPPLPELEVEIVQFFASSGHISHGAESARPGSSYQSINRVFEDHVARGCTVTGPPQSQKVRE